ncbi:MAG TPA: hypothetical protein P5137_01015 [Candidatus Brocadiia bacterium]|nr:hypothetical protein [Candidatus Brocadiia bacterium]
MPGTFTHANMRTGPAVIYFGGACLGVTLDEVEWTPETLSRSRHTARYGDASVDFIHTGEKHTVKATLAENSIAVLAEVLPEGATSGSTRYFGRVPGGKMSDHAKELRVRPVDRDAAGSADEDLVIYKAVVTSCAPVGWTVERERAFQVTFESIVDDTKADGKKIGYIRLGA